MINIFETIIHITAIDMCAIGNGHCQHICRVNYSLPFPYKECACEQYFKLAFDEQKCENNFCNERPDACGDNTTFCKTLETATDSTHELYECKYLPLPFKFVICLYTAFYAMKSVRV